VGTDIEWVTDWEDHTTDPQDGGGEFQFWWANMRPREVCDLAQTAYVQGYKRGLRERLAKLRHDDSLVVMSKAKWEALTKELERYRDQAQIKAFEKRGEE